MWPLSPSSIPLSLMNVVSGVTPIAETTISTTISFPLSNLTFIKLSTSSNPLTFSFNIILISLEFSSFSIKLENSESKGAITCGAASTKVTSMPLSLKFSAISIPINPPPITTADLVSLSSTKAFTLSVSGTFLTVNIFLLSIPGKLGLIGFAPGDNTK